MVWRQFVVNKSLFAAMKVDFKYFRHTLCEHQLEVRDLLYIAINFM